MEGYLSIASSVPLSMVYYAFLAVSVFVSFQYWIRTRCSWALLIFFIAISLIYIGNAHLELIV